VLAFLLVACTRCSSVEDTAEVRTREACSSHEPTRQVFWGDTHVHSSLSFDARAYEVTAGPEEAWAFARGEEVDGLRLARPLDFAAITDHAEYLAEIPACTDPASPAYAVDTCVNYREGPHAQNVQLFGVKMSLTDPDRFEDICEAIDCEAEALVTWQRIQDAAEAAYDRSSDCSFTSFVAYEWSGTPLVANMHRNVLFETWRVPERPTSYFEEPTAEGLWDALRRDCSQAGTGCDVLAIPHNSNLSNGGQFLFHADAESALVRAELEPLVEVYQHKGDSECRNGLEGILGEDDPLCDWEKVRDPQERPQDCGDEGGSGGLTYSGCVSRRDFLRGILLEGLEIQEQVGANPFRVGVIAATDTHYAMPGMVDEAAWDGHLGIAEDDPEERLADPKLNPGGIIDSPGGLAGVWAEENSRESLFAALQRRETFGTSGPRIELRMFAGDLPMDACDLDEETLLELAYRDGVPMGSELPDGQPARFVVWARADERALERLQLVKGWSDGEGEHIEVVELAGELVGDPDMATCEPGPGGQDRLCAVFDDLDWGGEPAFWYARAVEVPTCRWSWQDCLLLDEEHEACEDPSEHIQRERAWGSPVFSE
jgi:hypothetical protein